MSEVNRPFKCAVSFEPWLMVAPERTFGNVLRYELDAVAKIVEAERYRRLAAKLDPERHHYAERADAHLGAVGGE